jgi:hypothetical protein
MGLRAAEELAAGPIMYDGSSISAAAQQFKLSLLDKL